MTNIHPADARRIGLQPIMAGTLAAIVGYASTFTLVLAALTAAGASPQQAGSGLLSVCLALAVLNVVVSFRAKIPISFAWTTPGVDQAKLTGSLIRALTTILRMPMAMQMLIRPEPACCGEAPAAVSAASTRVKVLA